MKAEGHHDWAVLGDHPSALLSACILAQSGMSVVIIRLTDGSLTHEERGMVHDPESLSWTGVYDRGLFARCLNYFESSDPNEFPIMEEAAAEILTPSHRVFLNRDTRRLEFEMARELGTTLSEKLALADLLTHQTALLNQFWGEEFFRISGSRRLSENPDARTRPRLKPGADERFRKFWRARVGRVFPKSIRHFREIRRALDAQSHFSELATGVYHLFSGQDPFLGSHKITAEDLLACWAAVGHEGRIRGGMSALRGALLEKAKKLGVVVFEPRSLKKIHVVSGKLQGVQLADDRPFIQLKGAILGCAIDRIRDLFEVSGRTWWARLKTSPLPLGWKFTVAVEVHAEAIPAGMQPRAVWAEAGAPVLEIEIADPQEYLGGASEKQEEEHSKRLIYLRTSLPFNSESLNPLYQRKIAARMFQQLSELFPFLEFHVSRIFPDFRGSTPIDELSRVYGFVSLDMIPDRLRVLTGRGVGFESGISGLHVASDESYPRLGPVGSTVAALESVLAFTVAQEQHRTAKWRTFWESLRVRL